MGFVFIGAALAFPFLGSPEFYRPEDGGHAFSADVHRKFCKAQLYENRAQRPKKRGRLLEELRRTQGNRERGQPSQWKCRAASATWPKATDALEALSSELVLGICLPFA